MNITWQCKHFDELSAHELYTIVQLRNEVFVVEQQCVYQDADNKDQLCWHVMGWDNNRLAAYARLVPAGIAFREASIGRVVTSPGARGKGLGRELMQQAITLIYTKWHEKYIKIGAQLYLKQFYESIGFQQCSEVYLEDGIQHIEMLLLTVA